MKHPDLQKGDQILVGGELFATVLKNDGSKPQSCCLDGFAQSWWHNEHLDRLLSMPTVTVKKALPEKALPEKVEVDVEYSAHLDVTYVEVPYPEGSLVEVTLKEAK